MGVSSRPSELRGRWAPPFAHDPLPSPHTFNAGPGSKDSRAKGPVKATGLSNTPVTGTVSEAQRQALPPAEVAVRNLIEQVLYPSKTSRNTPKLTR